jgi:Spy/CpxP family protein refolding chaperone
MKRIYIGIIAIIVLIAGGIFVLAQRAEKGGFGWHGRGEMMFHALNLTDEQKTQVKQIMDASKAKVEPIREQLKANHEKLEAATANGAFDEAQVTTIANEQAGLASQLIVERERAKSQVFALLTDDQKAKASEMKAKMQERFKNRAAWFHHGDGEDNGAGF